MDLVLRNLIGIECWAYMDDIILFSETIEEHARRLDHVLERLHSANLQLQPQKCIFAQPQVQYLGYDISHNGISASPGKVQAVKNYPVPKTTRDVRAFLGLASFYRRLVPRFADLAKPLTELTKKDAKFKWEDKQ
jgi:hypothetical protein